MLPAAGATAGTWRPCTKQTKVLCGTVVTALDPSGRVPGTVQLHVEVLKTAGASGTHPKQAVFFLAGGPGQASAKEFDLVTSGPTFQMLFPGYALVAYDDRGTGRSGALACPGLDLEDTAGAAVARCGAKLGRRRAFYSTAANVADTDAVRRALGLDQIVLYGVSYGTRQALSYAASHPANTARLILDSVEPPTADDPFALRTIAAIPGSMTQLCRAGSCSAVTNDFAGDLARLANSLQKAPLTARIAASPGKTTKVRINGLQLVTLAVNSDLNAGVAAELPAAVSAALAGRQRPLERLVALAHLGDSGDGVNLAVGVATTCADGVFPWSSGAPVAGRSKLLDSSVSALPRAATAPFGNWAARVGSATMCKDWPPSPGFTPAKTRPYPDIPVLILAGSRDTRTPLSGAQMVAKQFPKSTLLVVDGAGHSLSSSSVCALTHVFTWFAGVGHGSCPRELPALAPLGPFESPPGSKSGAPGSGTLGPDETFAAAKATLQEAEAAFLAAFGSGKKLNGLLGGTLAPVSSGDQLAFTFSLAGYRDVTGVSLTGKVTYHPFATPRWTGSVDVSGPRAAGGALVEKDGHLAGSLGGKHVSAATAPA